METKAAIEAFAALAQETRLAVFRLLIQAGPSGLNAGEIAARVGVPGSTLSHHLTNLERAGLLRSWRMQRQIFYASDFEGTRSLIAFLMEDCCQGRPELCSADTWQAAECEPGDCGPGCGPTSQPDTP